MSLPKRDGVNDRYYLIPACGFLPAGRSSDCSVYLGICAEIEVGGSKP